MFVKLKDIDSHYDDRFVIVESLRGYPNQIVIGIEKDGETIEMTIRTNELLEVVKAVKAYSEDQERIDNQS